MIKTEDFMEDDGEREAMGSFINLNAEKKAISAMVDDFAEEMKKKLIKKHEEGYGGWDDLEYKKVLQDKLHYQIKKGEKDFIDIANFSAMLWNMEEGKQSASGGRVKKEIAVRVVDEFGNEIYGLNENLSDEEWNEVLISHTKWLKDHVESVADDFLNNYLR